MPFSPGAVAALARALSNFLSTWDEARHEQLRVAIAQLCTEAHAKQLGPERMLVAVKDTWRTIPGLGHFDHARRAVAFERVLGCCLDAYYATDAQ